ncbi:MAG: RagB/SusD family nutrient uptake outer membrane protein [Gemmatimonadetes bacterium]|nr:RagB/SusD family nutrient uptake outer membrane protein [Phycisphaerae bacterium]NNF14043.1 RagB/SusD family nutrient uptake outer membrane protein [Gemmatimonadota bacterium]
MIKNKSTKVCAVVLSLTGVLGGCSALDDLLAVDAPSQVVASDLENPASADLLVSSVANEVRCAYAYFAAASALTGNEWRDVSNNTVLNIWDSRTHDTSGYGAQYASADCGNTQPAIYQPQSRARWIADFTLELLDGWDVADVPDKAELQAEVGMHAGFAYLMMGESMCEVAFDNGPVVGKTEAFNLAVTRFDEAMAAGAAGDVLNAALVGKARAQLNLGQPASAALTVGPVPAGFAWELPFSDASNVTRNTLWNISVDDENVSPAEPYRGVQYNGVDDPRINTFYTGRDHPRTGLEIWNSDKFPNASSPLEMASYAEAQLIIAEAEIAGGNPDAAVAIIDAFHTAAGLDPYGSEGEATGPSDAQEVLEHLVLHERAAELFLEGQHLYDLTRHGPGGTGIIALFPAVGVDDGFGGQYSNQICFDLPATEFQNNTTLVGS